MSSKPRTPRYWPHMKVRGARRKQMRTKYAFQRLGDAASAASIPILGFGAALIKMQEAINRMHERLRIIEAEVAYTPFADPYDLADLGTSMMEAK